MSKFNLYQSNNQILNQLTIIDVILVPLVYVTDQLMKDYVNKNEQKHIIDLKEQSKQN